MAAGFKESLSMTFLFFNVYCDREREHMCASGGGGRERGRERIPSRLCTVRAEPNAGLKLTKLEIIT